MKNVFIFKMKSGMMENLKMVIIGVLINLVIMKLWDIHILLETLDIKVR